MTIKTSDRPTFRSCGHVSKKQYLFTVAPGADLADALNSVSDLLDSTYEVIFDGVMSENELGASQAWLVLHAIESARAVIDSLHDAAEDAARKDGGAQ